jgi:hypothetical protein
VGGRRLTNSRANVTAERIILDAGCVVSAPLPALSGPPLARGHRSEGGGTFLSGPWGHRRPSAVSWPRAPSMEAYLELPPHQRNGPPSSAKHKVFLESRFADAVGGYGSETREIWGIRLVFVALVMGLVWELLFFPVWSFDQGLNMRILLAFITVQPLQFILERVGPVGAIIVVVGAYLIERARPDPMPLAGRVWNRERLAIAFAVGGAAVFLWILGTLSTMPVAMSFLIREGTSLTVLIGLGLYLLWTAERLDGVFPKRLGPVAIAVALLAGALNFVTFARLFGLMEPSWSDYPTLTVATNLLAAGSLSIWIVIYGRILRRPRIAPPPIAPAAEA